MNAHAPPALLALAFLVAGAALGLAQLALLRLNVQLYLRGQGLLAPLALHLARALLAAAAFILIAPRGAVALLLALAGFTAGRLVLARRLA
jgi:hypothetical protein